MLFRRMIKAKIHKNNSAATIDEITAATNYILTPKRDCLMAVI